MDTRTHTPPAVRISVTPAGPGSDRAWAMGTRSRNMATASTTTADWPMRCRATHGLTLDPRPTLSHDEVRRTTPTSSADPVGMDTTRNRLSSTMSVP